MRENWKLWLTGTLVLVVLGAAIYRFRSSFTDQPPAWLHMREVASPSLSAELAGQFSALRTELENESKATGLSVQSMQLMELSADGKEIRIWRLDRLANPGPGPLTNFEVNHWLTDDRLVGYYMWDGTPLNFMLKHSPAHPKTAFAVVKLDQPVAPGATLTVMYIEHQPSNLKTNTAGDFSYQFPRWRDTDNSIQALGLILPRSYSLIRYSPATGAFTSTKGSSLVAWINTRVEPHSLPPTATFKPL